MSRRRIAQRLHRFGLICAMRGYRIIDGGSFIAIEPVAGLE